MPAASFTLYKLQQKELQFTDYCKEIINSYNQNSENDMWFKKKTNRLSMSFDNISNFCVYHAISKNIPEWNYVLNEIVTDLPEIINYNHSYVMFLECQNEIFAITGGRGYLVLENYKDYYFGLDLLSKLITPYDTLIKETTDKYLSGYRSSSHNQFLDFVTLNSESSFSNYFKNINVFFTKEKIEEFFGLRIESNKKNFKFIAKDSIKLGKSLRINELDVFINKICQLLNQESLSKINYFYEVNKKDPKYNILNSQLEREFISLVDGVDIENKISIVDLHTGCESYNLIRKSTKSVLGSYESNVDLEDVIQLYIDKFKESIVQSDSKNIIDDFFKTLKVQGIIDNVIIDDKTLFNLLEYKCSLAEKVYWLFDGNWYYLDDEFIANINHQFLSKVYPIYNETPVLEEINLWNDDQNEGQYNYSHIDKENVFVLDKIFVENIEVCDLLIIKEPEIYFVHVKEGLDRDARVLSAQILASMTAIQNAKILGDTNFFVKYYNSIINKIKDQLPENEQESKLSIAAKKFRDRFPNENEFIAFITRQSLELNFIFAFKPNGHELNHPETIKSVPAKIAMINLINEAKNFDFKLGILEIRNESQQENILYSEVVRQ